MSVVKDLIFMVVNVQSLVGVVRDFFLIAVKTAQWAKSETSH